MPKPAKQTDYERLGRLVAEMYDAVHPNRKRLYRTAFTKGLVSGFGGVLGATLVVALLLWLLSLLNQVPFVGPVFENLQRTIQRK